VPSVEGAIVDRDGDAAYPLLPFLGQGAETWPSKMGLCSTADSAGPVTSQRPSRAMNARKNRTNTVQIVSRQKAEVLMEFADKDAIPFRDTGGPSSYDQRSTRADANYPKLQGCLRDLGDACQGRGGLPRAIMLSDMLRQN
jgi:hypothetical protein